MNELDFMFMPRRSFSWDVAMTIAAADVNPAETGPDMKSIRNPKSVTRGYYYGHTLDIGVYVAEPADLPNCATPMISCTIPVMKHNRMANSGPISCMFSRVMMAIIAVGPIAGSLQLPNIV